MIRRNILTDEQARADFINGVHLLKQREWTQGLGVYDFFVFWHYRAMMLATPDPPNPAGSRRNAAHWGPVFLPWHRYMLLMLEFQLQDVLGKPDFRLPYWDWASDAANPLGSAIWSSQVMGGTGSPVGSGPFQRFGTDGREWEVRLAEDPSTATLQRVSRGLRRNLRGQGSIPTSLSVRNLVSLRSTYDSFPWDDSSSGSFRIDNEIIHGSVHIWMSRDMATSTSPNDPVFFLHHCNLDRIWRAWQVQHGEQNYVPDQTAPQWLLFHRLTDRMHTFFNHTVTPQTVLASDTFYQYDTLSL